MQQSPFACRKGLCEHRKAAANYDDEDLRLADYRRRTASFRAKAANPDINTSGSVKTLDCLRCSDTCSKQERTDCNKAGADKVLRSFKLPYSGAVDVF